MHNMHNFQPSSFLVDVNVQNFQPNSFTPTMHKYICIYIWFLTRMVYIYYISCLRYTILIGNPRYILAILYHCWKPWPWAGDHWVYQWKSRNLLSCSQTYFNGLGKTWMWRWSNITSQGSPAAVPCKGSQDPHNAILKGPETPRSTF